jgi:hypothetical protein
MNPGKKFWKTYVKGGSSKSSVEKSKSQSKIKILKNKGKKPM